jgi:hypothetical protein
MNRNRMLFVVALTGLLIAIAVAQDGRLPEASLDREVNVRVPAQAEVLGNPRHAAQTPPSFCRPCLFYAGDFDSNASDANGLANEDDIVVSSGAATYVPFIVPKGKVWNVTGLLTLNFMSGFQLDPNVIPYEVRKGIPRSGGDGGQLVCHGRKPATVIASRACQGFGFECFYVRVNNVKACRLAAGKYWVSVVPYCTTGNSCTGDWRAFVTNDDGAMVNRYGPLEPANDSFFNSVYFGAVWEPTIDQQTSKRFSAGVEGTEK